jgi:hypothetical protein
MRVVSDMNTNLTGVESFILDKISRNGKTTHKLTIDLASHHRVENDRIMKAILIKNLVNLKHVKFIGGSLNVCNNNRVTVRDTPSRVQHVTKWKFNEADERALPCPQKVYL